MSQPPQGPYGNPPGGDTSGDPWRKEPHSPSGAYGQGVPGQGAPGPQSPYPQPGYPQPGYGAPGQPDYGTPGGAYQPPRETNGIAVVGLVLAIVGIVGSWIPLVNVVALLIAIAGVVLGIVGLSKAAKGAGGKGLSIAATIVGGVGVVSSVIALIVYALVINAVGSAAESAGHELDRIAGNASEEILANELNIEFGDFTGEADDYGFVDSSLPITITNTSDESHSFSFTVQALDQNGAVIDTDLVITGELQAGQSTTKNAFEFVSESDLDAFHTATFQAVDASAY